MNDILLYLIISYLKYFIPMPRPKAKPQNDGIFRSMVPLNFTEIQLSFNFPKLSQPWQLGLSRAMVVPLHQPVATSMLIGKPQQ